MRHSIRYRSQADQTGVRGGGTTKKQPAKKRGDSDNDDDDDEEEEDDKLHEKIKLQDGAVIINYEVAEEPEEIVYAGGIKGIRALRKQRDVFEDQE